MKLTYTNITGSGYLENSDEYEEWGEEFNYEVDWDEELNALTDIIFNNFFNKIKLSKYKNLEIKKCLRSLIENWSDEEIENWEETYYDELHDYFKEDAYNSIE